jgi:DNA polymerase-3 subunit beta
MRFTLPRAAFLAALTQVKAAVERRTTIPILANVLITVTATRVTLKATDLDMEVLCSLESRGDVLPGAVTVPAVMLTDIVRKMSDKADVTLELLPDGNAVRVAAGRTKMNLLCLPASDFPDIAGGEYPTQFALVAEDLARMISRVEFAISTEETRYYLNGIYLHMRAIDGRKWLRAVSTDGHRLARYDMTPPSEDLEFPGVIIPSKTVARLREIAKGFGDGALTIELSESKIRVTAGAIVLSSKLIDGTFPDYARVIPTGNDKIAILDRAALASAIDRVSTIASERGRAVKMAFGAGTLQLLVVNADAGQGEETLDVNYDGDDFAIGFNSRYVADALAVLDADQVEMRLSEAGLPALLTVPDDETLAIVLMPMRV